MTGEKFISIVFTSPVSVADEALKITRLLEAGVDMVHIRKPYLTLAEVCSLIEDIPYKYRKRLRLHGHFELLTGMTLGGVHLNSRNPMLPATTSRWSKSCHTFEEIRELDGYDYVTLSPIFDSISKKGYEAQFNLESISEKIRGKRVVALGGVTPEKFKILKNSGFYGAALLGFIWEGDFEQALSSLKNALNTLQ